MATRRARRAPALPLLPLLAAASAYLLLALLATAGVRGGWVEECNNDLEPWSNWGKCTTCPAGGLVLSNDRRRHRRALRQQTNRLEVGTRTSHDLVVDPVRLTPGGRGMVYEDIRPDSRIIGGVESEQNKYSFMVALFLEEDGRLYTFCGGALVGMKHVLTAAHCVEYAIDEGYGLVAGVGRHNLGKFTDGVDPDGTFAENIPVKDIKIFPKYNNLDNDVALLELDRPVSKDQIPIPIAVVEGSPPLLRGQSLTVLGWGTMVEGSNQSPNTLREVAVPLLDDEQCKMSYGSSFKSLSMFCAGVKNGGIDSCQGDSGGPIIYENPDAEPDDVNRFELVGLVSWGYGCAARNYPGVYVDLKYFALVKRKWLIRVSGGDIRTSCEIYDPLADGIEYSTRLIPANTGCWCEGTDSPSAVGCKPRSKYRICGSEGGSPPPPPPSPPPPPPSPPPPPPGEDTCEAARASLQECLMTELESGLTACLQGDKALLGRGSCKGKTNQAFARAVKNGGACKELATAYEENCTA